MALLVISWVAGLAVDYAKSCSSSARDVKHGKKCGRTFEKVQSRKINFANQDCLAAS
jgi:hypothetical protein